MKPALKQALDRFDQAARDYAFKGSLEPARREEAVDEYHRARKALEEMIDRDLNSQYLKGKREIQSRIDFPDNTGR